MMKYLLCILLSTAFFHTEEIDITKPLRIQSLIPKDLFTTTLCIEPALPQDFVALKNSNEDDLVPTLYWGPDEVLKAYFKDPTSLTVPIIRIELSIEMTQDYLFTDLDVESLTKAFEEDCVTAFISLGN